MKNVTPRTAARASVLAKTLQREMVKVTDGDCSPTHTQCLEAIAKGSGFETLYDYQQAAKKGATMPDWNGDLFVRAVMDLGRSEYSQCLAVVDVVEAVASRRAADPFKQLLGEIARVMGRHEHDSFDVARMLKDEGDRRKAEKVLESIPEGPSRIEWDMLDLDEFDDTAEHAEEYYDLIQDLLPEASGDDDAFEQRWEEFDRIRAMVVAEDQASIAAHPVEAVAKAARDLVDTERQRKRANARAVLDANRIVLTSNRHGVASPIGPVSVCYQVRDDGWSEEDVDDGVRTCIGYMTVTAADGKVAGVLRTEHTVPWKNDVTTDSRNLFWEMDSHDANEVYKAILNDHLPEAGYVPTSAGMDDWIDRLEEDNEHIVVVDPGVTSPHRGHRMTEWMTARMVAEISSAIFRGDPDAAEYPDVEMDYDLLNHLGHPGLIVFSVTGSPWDAGSGGNDPRLTGKRPPTMRNDKDEDRKAGLNRYVASMGRIAGVPVMSYDLFDYPAEFGVAA